MIGANELLILLMFVAFPVVGGLIGRSRGRPVLGVALGLFLGIIGWLIIAVIPRKK